MSGESKYCDHIGLWEKELKAWIPDEIFDAHVHIGRKEDAGEFSKERLKNAASTFSHMTLEEMARRHSDVYSGKRIAGVFAFAFPLMEVDYVRANEYVADAMVRDPKVKGFIWTNQKDVSLTVDVFRRAERKGARFVGAKPYYDILGKSNFDTVMEEILPRKLLEFINSERLTIMLHTTGKGVGDEKTRDYIKFICDKFPDIRIVLAHMGRHLSVSDFEAFMESELPDIPSLFLEMSSSSQAEIYRMVLEKPRLRGRLLFGSDVPFGLITGMERWSPTAGAIFWTRDRHTWSEPGSYGHTDMTYNTYHVIKALKGAMESMKFDKEEGDRIKNDIFCGNAGRLSAA